MHNDASTMQTTIGRSVGRSADVTLHTFVRYLNIGKCNARIAYSGDTIADSEYIALISYDTLICVYKATGRTLFVNGMYFKYSNTTIRHLSKFLHQMQIGVSYHDIKRWSEIVNPITGEIKNIDKYREYYNFNTCILFALPNGIWNLNALSTSRDDKLVAFFNGKER